MRARVKLLPKTNWSDPSVMTTVEYYRRCDTDLTAGLFSADRRSQKGEFLFKEMIAERQREVFKKIIITISCYFQPLHCSLNKEVRNPAVGKKTAHADPDRKCVM